MPKLSSQRRRRNKPERRLWTVIVVRRCNAVEGCLSCVGSARHDPEGRWCASNHEQNPPQPYEERRELR